MWHGVCPMNKIVNYTVLKFQTKKINTNLYKWCHSSTSRCRCYTFPSLNAAESRSVRPTPTVRAGRDNSRRCSPPLLRGKLHRIKVRLRINNRTRRIMRSACFVHRRRRKTPTVCTPKIMAIKKLFPMKNRVRATPPETLFGNIGPVIAAIAHSRICIRVEPPPSFSPLITWRACGAINQKLREKTHMGATHTRVSCIYCLIWYTVQWTSDRLNGIDGVTTDPRSEPKTGPEKWPQLNARSSNARPKLLLISRR